MKNILRRISNTVKLALRDIYNMNYCISSVDGMRNDFQKADYQGTTLLQNAAFGRNQNRAPGLFSRGSAGALRRPPGTRFLCKKPGPGPSGKNSNIASGISRLSRYCGTVERLVAARIRRLVQIIKTFLTPKISSLERSLNHFFSGKQEIKCY